MSQWLEVAEARNVEGIRLVLTAGAPGPWGEAAKAMLHVKQIPFVRVRQEAGLDNEDLVAWTGIRNAPQIVDEGDRAIDTWLDMIFFAETHARASTAAPRLIPDDIEDRVRMFGLIREIAGQRGFAWYRRIGIFRPVMAVAEATPDPALDPVKRMAAEYGYSDSEAEGASRRIVEVLDLLDAQLKRQAELGRPYLIGDRLSALDLYWATFAALVAPLPHEQCPMPEYLRKTYCTIDDDVARALTSGLLAHRDAIYTDYLELPVEL